MKKPTKVVHYNFGEEYYEDREGDHKRRLTGLEQFVCETCFEWRWKRGKPINLGGYQFNPPEEGTWTFMSLEDWLKKYGDDRDW